MSEVNIKPKATVTLTMEIRRKDGTHETITVPATLTGIDELQKLLAANGQLMPHAEVLRNLVKQQEPDANG